jgi:6-phosphogluconolactonase
MVRTLRWTALAALALSGCSRDIVAPTSTQRLSLTGTLGLGNGAVYTLSNRVEGNAVLALSRSPDGSLTRVGDFNTGGTGTGAALGSQGAIVLSSNGQYLFAVNAGSNTISSFAVRPDRLELIGSVASGGTLPISLTVHEDLLYVLNSGRTNNITGFRLKNGSLTHLPASTRPLSTAAAGPAQVEFSPSGEFLVVTEKATNNISTYAVGNDGRASDPVVNASAGATPFGFAFGRHGRLIVSEAFGGAVDASAASSYDIGDDGQLTILSASVPTTETAACWFVVTNSGNFAYTTNTGSGSISGYHVASDGALSLLTPDGRTAVTGDGSAPTDLALSVNSQYLYSLNSGNGTMSGFSVAGDGSLTDIAVGVAGLPASAVGLAGR